MAEVKAALETANGKRLWIELDSDKFVTIGHANDDRTLQPDYDLDTILPTANLDEIGARHAALTYRNGDVHLSMLDGHQVWIGPYELRPGLSFRVVDKDMLKFGTVKLTLRLIATGKVAEAGTSGS